MLVSWANYFQIIRQPMRTAILSFLIVLFCRLSPDAHAQDSCDLSGDLQRLPQIMNEVKLVGSHQGCAPIEPIPRAELGCPYYLKSQLRQDLKKGWLGTSPAESCELVLKAAKEMLPSTLERLLASHPQTQLGANPDYLTKNCRSSGPASAPSLSDQKIEIAEYYLNMNRLKAGALSSIEIVANLDSTLGKKPLTAMDCGRSSRLPQIEKSCAKLQSCAPAGGLAEQARELQAVWPMVQALEEEVRVASSRNRNIGMGVAYGAKFDGAAFDGNQETIATKSQQLALLRSLYPALNGKEFKKFLDPKKLNFEEALRKQIEGTRSRLMAQVEKYRQGIECLNTPLTCGACKDFEKTLSEAPEFHTQILSGSSSGSSNDALTASTFLSSARCRQETRSARADAGQAVSDFTVGAGLTIATAGLSSVVAATQAASVAATAARTANATSKLGALTSKAGLARAAILGTDLGFAGKGLDSAIDKCSASLNQLSPNPNQQPSASACPMASGSGQTPQLMADYRACVMSVMLDFAPNLLPFAPALVRAVRSPAKPPLASTPKAAEPSQFTSLKEVESFREINPPSKVGMIVLDANVINPEQAKRLGVTVIDHHGAYRNVDKPFQNTTRKIVDLYEEAATEVGKNAQPQEIQDAFRRKLLDIPPGQPLPEKLVVSTDNLGDAAIAKWLIDNPSALAQSESRRLFKMAAFHEDYAHFGTRYQEYIAKGGQAGKNFEESVEFAQSVMGANDRIIRKYNAEAKALGKPPVFVGDRFDSAAPEIQSKIMAESVSEIDKLFKDPAYRSSIASELRTNMKEAAEDVQKYALVRNPESKLVRKTRAELGDAEVDRIIGERLAIIDGDKLVQSRGQFTNWGAIPGAHKNPLQLQLTDRDGGKVSTFIMAIPQGRKDLGLINNSLRNEIVAAAKLKDPNFNAGGVVLRDSGLLFSFAGVPLSKQEVSAIVIKHIAQAEKAASPVTEKAATGLAQKLSQTEPKAALLPETALQPVRLEPVVPVAPKTQIIDKPSWFPASHSAETLAKRPLQPPPSAPIVFKTLDRSACPECPDTIRAASPMSHARDHFWDHAPPSSGETQQTWLARRARERKVTSIFPPGVTQKQVIEQAAKSNLRATSDGQNATLTGKVLLDFAGPRQKLEKAYFEVKIVVCKTHCEPNRPGDVISIIPIKGPGIQRAH